VVEPPEEVVVRLDPPVTQNVANATPVEIKVIVTGVPGTKRGKSHVFPDLVVHESCVGCKTENNKTTRDTAIQGPTVVDGRAEKILKYTAFDAKGGEGTVTVTVTANGKDYPPATAKMGWDPAVQPKTACENSRGENQPGDHCKCPPEMKLMEGMIDGKWVCVPKPELPKLPPVVAKDGKDGAPGAPGRSGVVAHFTLDFILGAVWSENFKTSNLFLAAGAAFELTPKFDLYTRVGVGIPGAKRTDTNGELVLNDAGNGEKKYFSGLIEGGVRYWLTDYAGLRFGAAYIPIGITEGLKFLHAELGGVAGVDFRIRLGSVVLVPGIQLFVGGHLKSGVDSADSAYGVLFNIGASFFNNTKPSASAVAEDEESDGDEEVVDLKGDPFEHNKPAAASAPQTKDGRKTL
jgi:hypothetical protein